MALQLVDYWAQCPPTHLMLKAIGGVLGIRVQGGTGPQQLSEVEKQVEAGYIPGVGNVPVVEYGKLPPTVREFIVKNKDKQHA